MCRKVRLAGFDSPKGQIWISTRSLLALHEGERLFPETSAPPLFGTPFDGGVFLRGHSRNGRICTMVRLLHIPAVFGNPRSGGGAFICRPVWPWPLRIEPARSLFGAIVTWDQAIVCKACGATMNVVRALPRVGRFPELHVFQCERCAHLATRESRTNWPADEQEG
jgi:hypothetical protein